MEHGQPSSQPYSQNRFQRSKSFKNLGSGLNHEFFQLYFFINRLPLGRAVG